MQRFTIHQVKLKGVIHNEPILRCMRDGSFVTEVILITQHYLFNVFTEKQELCEERHHVTLSDPRLETDIAQLLKGRWLRVEGHIQTNQCIDRKTGKQYFQKIIICKHYHISKCPKELPLRRSKNY